MTSVVSKDVELLRVGLETLHEASLTGHVTVVVIDEAGGVLTGDLPTLIVKMGDALRRVEDVVERLVSSSRAPSRSRAR